MENKTDRRVDEFIENLTGWKQEVCKKVRKIVHEADQGVMETIKRTDRPYFTLDGNICAFQVTKDHINIFIYDPIAPDPEKIINQGEGNKTARSIQIYENDKINETALLNLFKAVIANNRKGGWRNI
ncbi:MAG: DUF1801 domain-containing protein [Candidatus Dojkabacteria bacterium]